jgi:hypothetical protein
MEISDFRFSMPIRRVARAVIALPAFAASAAAPLYAQGISTDRTAMLHGVFAVQPDAQERLEEAVERAIAPLNFVVRSVARRRLLAVNKPSGRVEILVRGDSVVLRYAGQPEVRARRNGTARPWRNAAGEQISVEVRAPAQASDTTPLLSERYVAEDGIRENRWFLDAATSRVRLEVSVSSPRLPSPLALQLAYTRLREPLLQNQR